MFIMLLHFRNKPRFVTKPEFVFVNYIRPDCKAVFVQM